MHWTPPTPAFPKAASVTFIAGEIAKKHLQPQDVRVEVNLEERTVSIDLRYQAEVDLILRRMSLAFHASARRHAMPSSEDAKEYGIPKP